MTSSMLPKAILFTTGVLFSRSDDPHDVQTAVKTEVSGVSAWPSFWLDVSRYPWLTETNLSVFDSSTYHVGRVHEVSNLIHTFVPSISFDDAQSLANQLCAVFKTKPSAAKSSDLGLYTLALRRCKYVGELRALDTRNVHYVIDNATQLSEWVSGNSLHNYKDDTCCPDFSCCCPDLLISKNERIAFQQAPNELREAILPNLLGSMLSKLL